MSRDLTEADLKVERDRLMEGGRTPDEVRRMQQAADGRVEHALIALMLALREDPGASSDHWMARLFVRQCGEYDGDLSGDYMLGAVCRLALAVAGTPPAVAWAKWNREHPLSDSASPRSD